MAPPHNRRLKVIQFALGTPPTQFECQVRSATVANNTADGDQVFTLCPEGEFREETDPNYALEIQFLSDWRSNGISDFLVEHDGEIADFTYEHHPDIPAEHTTRTGQVYIKAPNQGGEARATETQEVTLLCIGKPTYTRELP